MVAAIVGSLTCSVIVLAYSHNVVRLHSEEE